MKSVASDKVAGAAPVSDTFTVDSLNAKLGAADGFAVHEPLITLNRLTLASDPLNPIVWVANVIGSDTVGVKSDPGST